ncbi:MAG TPA: energy transducer TonB [Bryobacteraceae bacterium]
MPLEPSAPRGVPAEAFRECLVDGDLQQRSLERRVRRRALGLSVVFQGAALAALIIVPLFGKSPQITAREYTPIPPYYHSAAQAQTSTPSRQAVRRQVCVICPTLPIRPHAPAEIINEPAPLSPETGISIGDNIPGAAGPLNIIDNRQPPPPVEPSRQQTRRVHITHVEPAMLTNRVEPIYPPLMQQIRRSGRVELRAIIATDGTIQSLQVVSGDPGFYQSALAAVAQWRYKPTYLNGQPVEVETNISVIYNLAQ